MMVMSKRKLISYARERGFGKCGFNYCSLHRRKGAVKIAEEKENSTGRSRSSQSAKWYMQQLHNGDVRECQKKCSQSSVNVTLP